MTSGEGSYHVKVVLDDGWYVGRVLERPGVTTQARSLDGLVEMLRDAIEQAWGEKKVRLELLLPAQAKARPTRRRAA
ncbi:MAG: type II toxin-antitoxin system HicB family antitoxin [Phycisphaerales bacterium]